MLRASLKMAALAGILLVAACSDGNNSGEVVEPPPPPPPPPTTLIQDRFGATFSAIFKVAATTGDPTEVTPPGDLPAVSLTTDPIDF